MFKASLSELTAGASLPSPPPLPIPLPSSDGAPLVEPVNSVPEASAADGVQARDERMDDAMLVEFANDGTTAEIVSMLGHAFEGFSLPPPAVTVRLTPAGLRSVRVSINFAPNFSAIGTGNSSAADEFLANALGGGGIDDSEAERAVAAASEVLEIGDDAAMKAIMMALAKQLAEGDAADEAGEDALDDLVDASAIRMEVVGSDGADDSALSALISGLRDSRDAAESRTQEAAPLPPSVALSLSATGAQSVRLRLRALTAAPSASCDDIFGLLGSLRDQLVNSDYVATHPGDPSLLPLPPEGLGKDTLMGALAEVDAEDIIVGDNFVSGELADLLGTLRSQLAVLPKGALEAGQKSASTADEVPEDWERAADMTEHAGSKRVYAKEGLLNFRAACTECPPELAGRYDNPEVIIIAEAKTRPDRTTRDKASAPPPPHPTHHPTQASSALPPGEGGLDTLLAGLAATLGDGATASIPAHAARHAARAKEQAGAALPPSQPVAQQRTERQQERTSREKPAPSASEDSRAAFSNNWRTEPRKTTAPPKATSRAEKQQPAAKFVASKAPQDASAGSMPAGLPTPKPMTAAEIDAAARAAAAVAPPPIRPLEQQQKPSGATLPASFDTAAASMQLMGMLGVSSPTKQVAQPPRPPLPPQRIVTSSQPQPQPQDTSTQSIFSKLASAIPGQHMMPPMPTNAMTETSWMSQKPNAASADLMGLLGVSAAREQPQPQAQQQQRSQRQQQVPQSKHQRQQHQRTPPHQQQQPDAIPQPGVNAAASQHLLGILGIGGNDSAATPYAAAPALPPSVERYVSYDKPDKALNTPVPLGIPRVSRQPPPQKAQPQSRHPSTAHNLQPQSYSGGSVSLQADPFEQTRSAPSLSGYGAPLLPHTQPPAPPSQQQQAHLPSSRAAMWGFAVDPAAPERNDADPWSVTTLPGGGDGDDFFTALARQTAQWHGQRRG